MFSFFTSDHKRPPWFVANFDSSTGLLKALANALHGKGFAGVGSIPESELLAKAINALPWKLQRSIYVKGSIKGTVDPQKLGEVQAEDYMRWVTQFYPKKKYPAILIGSSSGPAVHLAAAMGIPWLPQTFLIPVKTPGLSADEPIRRMEWAKPWAEELLASNPDLQLHHMMDPSQDRPMLETTSYFRVKILQAGATYTQFIKDHLDRNGTLLTVECQKRWQVTEVGSRHNFQFGGLGGTSPQEYLHGSREVKEFLQHQGSPYEQWDVPNPTGEAPESEWGFVPSLRTSLVKLAKEQGYTLQRIVFDEPEDLSPFVADLYRWWYQHRSIPATTLLVDMFFLTDPYWTLRMGAVPFWLAFNAQPSVERLKDYLKKAQPYDNIYLMPFSNGVEGIRIATADHLKSILSFARKEGAFIGSEPTLYPFDFGMFARYEKSLKEKSTQYVPMEEPLSLQQLHLFALQFRENYKVTFPAEETSQPMQQKGSANALN